MRRDVFGGTGTTRSATVRSLSIFAGTRKITFCCCAVALRTTRSALPSFGNAFPPTWSDWVKLRGTPAREAAAWGRTVRGIGAPSYGNEVAVAASHQTTVMYVAWVALVGSALFIRMMSPSFWTSTIGDSIAPPYDAL